MFVLAQKYARVYSDVCSPWLKYKSNVERSFFIFHRRNNKNRSKVNKNVSLKQLLYQMNDIFTHEGC